MTHHDHRLSGCISYCDNFSGHQLATFNAQATIQIGGKQRKPQSGRERVKREAPIERPFTGVISGLVFNNLRILDLAAEGDPRVTVDGDVSMALSLDVKSRLNPEAGFPVRTVAISFQRPAACQSSHYVYKEMCCKT